MPLIIVQRAAVQIHRPKLPLTSRHLTPAFSQVMQFEALRTKWEIRLRLVCIVYQESSHYQHDPLPPSGSCNPQQK